MALLSTWAGRFRVRQYVKGSLWLLPLLGALAGAALGGADASAEGHVQLPEAWTYSASTASGVLTAIVAAMVALIGFVVTIGVLVVQTATGTLSPRFDGRGARRVILPARTFEGYLRLGVTEIAAYGAGAIQVCRRLAAMFDSVAEVVDPADRPALDAARARFEAAVAGAFPAPPARELAWTPDRQGIGGPAWLPEPVVARDGSAG
jgi:uncharacterized membrane protein